MILYIYDINLNLVAEGNENFVQSYIESGYIVSKVKF